MCKYLFESLLSLLLGIYPEAELQDCMIIVYFNFLRNLYTVFLSDHTILYCYEQHIRVPLSPHPHQHFLFLFFKNNSHPNGCEMMSHHGFDLHFPND